MTTALSPDPVATAPWQIDTAHTEIEFSARHLMISNVKGRFSKPSGSVSYDPGQPDSLQLDVTIPVASVDTRNEQRDAHLRSADFFDAEHHPAMTFRGARIKGDIAGRFKLIGDLTIRGNTREVTLDVTSEGAGADPWGNDRIGFELAGTVDRTDFGLEWNAQLPGGGFLLPNEVGLKANIAAIKVA